MKRKFQLIISGQKVGKLHPRECVFKDEFIEATTLNEAKRIASQRIGHTADIYIGMSQFDRIVPFFPGIKMGEWSIPEKERDPKGKPFFTTTKASVKPVGPKKIKAEQMHIFISLNWYKPFQIQMGEQTTHEPRN